MSSSSFTVGAYPFDDSSTLVLSKNFCPYFFSLEGQTTTYNTSSYSIIGGCLCDTKKLHNCQHIMCC